MSALDAIPGYTALKAQVDAARQQALQFQAQRNAASDAGNTQAYDQYQQQYEQASRRADELNSQLGDLIQADVDRELASPTVTTGQSQSTPAPNPRDDAPGQSTTSGGVGAGTSSNAYNSVNNDDNSRATGASNQSVIAASTAQLNQLITTQPNQLDQYASYTYNLAWYLLSPAQFNAMVEAQKANVAGWQLLMQSGGAPVAGRSTAFPYDYYMDDLEIESVIPLGGTRMSNSATNIRFKVVEPNGITLIQNLFNAVVAVYKNAAQSQSNTQASQSGVAGTTSVATPNYLQAHYCMVIEFFGYDSNGNLVAPAKGTFSSSGGYGQTNAIVKYYPFRIMDIKFAIANRAIEYNITGLSIPISYGNTTDRGTVPYAFTMTGQNVDQLLNGAPVTAGSTNTADPGARKDQPAPPATASVNDISVNAGVDQLGNFTGQTYNPNAVVAP